ncbi:hypothetical protein DFH06DRAFT_578585 [Mycena polygramma]|nr:hypothetical protein DFH06DRAFT_578585 [Mycena polygramma]
MRRRDRFKRVFEAIMPSRPSSPGTSPLIQPQPGGAPQIRPRPTITIDTDVSSSGITISTADPQLAPSPSGSVLAGTGPSLGELPVAGADSKELVIDNLRLVFDVVEKLGGFAQTVPFIAPVAGLLSQIVKGYNEIKDTHDKRDLLIARVIAIAQDLYATVCRMEDTAHIDLIERLRPDIETYIGFALFFCGSPGSLKYG